MHDSGRMLTFVLDSLRCSLVLAVLSIVLYCVLGYTYVNSVLIDLVEAFVAVCSMGMH